jgi:hypothetical protein
MKAIIVAGLVLGAISAGCSEAPSQKEGSGQPDPVTIATRLESKPSKHVVNANRVKECIGATYTRWTSAEGAPVAPTTLLTAVSACAREHSTEAFQDYVSIHGSGLGTLLDLVERQQEGERGEAL